MARMVVPEYLHHVPQRGFRSPVFQGDGDRRSYLEFMSQETQPFWPCFC